MWSVALYWCEIWNVWAGRKFGGLWDAVLSKDDENSWVKKVPNKRVLSWVIIIILFFYSLFNPYPDVGLPLFLPDFSILAVLVYFYLVCCLRWSPPHLGNSLFSSGFPSLHWIIFDSTGCLFVLRWVLRTTTLIQPSSLQNL